MSKTIPLKEQQKRFCDFYIELGVGTAAAVKAGYSEKSARSRASKLLDDPRIQDFIAERMKEKESDRIASQDEILQFLTSVMRGEEIEQVPLLAGDGFQALRDLDRTPLSHRVKAAEMIGKRHVMWTEKQQVEGDISIEVKIDYGD